MKAKPIPLYHCAECGDRIDGLQWRLSQLRAANARPLCRDCVTAELTRLRDLLEK